MRELKDLKVELTSILYDEYEPANEEKAIIKRENGILLKSNIEVTKFDEIKGILEVIVYRGNKDVDNPKYVDSQGDFISNTELEKACEWNLDYLINKGQNTPSDTNHNFEIAEGVYLMQTWVDKSEENWIWRQKINIAKNDLLMEKAKAGTINGVSLAGEARTEEKEKGLIKEIKELINTMKNLFKKEKDMTKDEIMAMTDEELAELGLMKKPETSSEPEQKQETETEPDEVQEMKADLTKFKDEFDNAKTELESIKEQLKTKTDELESVKKERHTEAEEEEQEVEKTIDDYIAEKNEKIMQKYKRENR